MAYFKVLAVPFGATGSVAAFLRISSAIGVKGLLLPWSVFFDDFTALAPTGTEANVTFFAEGLFKLLGMKYAAEGSKALPFATEFKTLGLVLDARDIS